MSGPYFRSQKEKDEHEAKMREVYSKLPAPEPGRHSDNRPAPKPKRKHWKPESGFKLGSVMPQELLDKAYAYRRRQKRDKIKGSFNKGDQHYGKKAENPRRNDTARAA